MSGRLAKIAAGVVGLGLIAGFGLWMRPPELVRVGASYAAKTVCSNVFLADRDPAEVLRTDVQAPGHPLLRLIAVHVDRERGVVRAGLFGFIGNGTAVFRSDTGCAVWPGGLDEGPRVPAEHRAPGLRASGLEAPGFGATDAGRSHDPWPDGDAVRTEASMERVLDDDALAGPGMRAIVVVQDGRIVAERYGGGFSPQTPQLGWSMAKTVVAGMIGILVQDGRLSLDQSAGWTAPDPRSGIRVSDLLSMSSGLRFDEGYAAVSDVTRMLYLEPDMARFARAQPLVHPIGSVWNYSSGSAVILARMIQDAMPGAGAAPVRLRLFEPLGMSSAVFETDAHGTLVGSSYLYATPRDWARYGQLLAQDGVWRGRALLPSGFVAMMASPLAASKGEYGLGLVWRRVSPQIPGTAQDAAAAPHPDSAAIPADTFWMAGHDGQYVAVIRSRGLVVVRMGLTPSGEHYRPEPLVRALLAATNTGSRAALMPASAVRGESRR